MRWFVPAAVAALLGTILSAPSTTLADGSSVALGGYCPVAYVVMGKAVHGDPDFSSTHESRIYHLVDKKAKGMFDKDPAKYVNAIKYDAWCATAMSMGKWSATEPDQFAIRSGSLYLFTNAEAKAMFEKDPEGTIKKADENWKKLAPNK